MQTQVLGLSVDSAPCLQAWADSLGGISYPLLSDFWPHGQVAQRFGVLRPEGTSERAIFVIDKQGIIRYVDVHDIEQQPDNEVLFAALAEVEPALAAAAVRQPAVTQRTADVVLYCTLWCPDCRKARAFFRDRGIKYQEIDISADRDAARLVRGWASGYETTPTIDIAGNIIVGFDQPKVEKTLAAVRLTGSQS